MDAELFPFEPPLRWEHGQIDELLLWGTHAGMSDMLLQSGDPAWMRLHGHWRRVSERPITADELFAALEKMTRNNSVSASLKSSGSDYDFSYQIEETRGVRKALALGTVMFFIGVLLGYFMVYPLTLRFLSTYQLSTLIENQISLNSYINNFMMLVLCMGLAFELPLLTWLLSLLGLVNKAFLRKYRRHAVVVIVILAAVITPTGDPFTLSVVAIPLYLLYELSIRFVREKQPEKD